MKTSYGGLYEVFMNGSIQYTDEKVSDRAQHEGNAAGRGGDQRVKGDGKRPLFVFSDLLCPYCRRLEQELERLNNVTIYAYLFPTERTFPGTTVIAKSI